LNKRKDNIGSLIEGWWKKKLVFAFITKNLKAAKK